MKTLVISIGVSEYQCKLWGKLPGARHDAYRVKSFFHLWGIANDSIILLEGENATRNNILNAIRISPLMSDIDYDTVIIYYAGHGEINKENANKPEHILFCYDTSPYDKTQTGIKVNELVQGIQRCNPLRVFLFIDACYVQITDFPEYILSGDEGAWSKKCFFSYVSTCGQKSQESKRGGVFTTLLLQGLSILHASNGTCSDLISFFEKETIIQDIPKPRGYWIGSCDTAFFANVEKRDIVSLLNQSYVERIDSISQITTTLLMHPSNRCFCFYGNAKAGKTILALELAHFFTDYTYYSVDFYRTVEEIKADLAKCILESLKKVGENIFWVEGDIDSVLKLAYFLKHPITIILDHAERLSTDNLRGLLDKFHLHDIVMVAFSRTPLVIPGYDILNQECPVFSKREFLCLANQNSNEHIDSINLYYEIYKGKPQEFHLMSQKVSGSEIYTRNEKAISFICACNGFVDIGFFCKKFIIPLDQVYQLLSCGLLQKADDRFIPHESLFDYFEFDKNAFIFNDNSTQYWIGQLIRQPDNKYANDIVLKMVITRGITYLEDYTDRILRILIDYYTTHFNWRVLESLFPHALSIGNAQLILSIAMPLAHVANNIILVEDKHVEMILDIEATQYWKLAISEVLFWKGFFDESIEICNAIIASSKDQYVLHCAYLNKGISYFFLGEWGLSCSTLERITLENDRVIGWKWLILGTIYAIRGLEFDRGISLLLKCVDILAEIHDYIGLGIAYGNIGECYYKRNDFDIASYYLHLADELTILTNDEATRLEVLRNKLMVYLANNHCYDADAEQIAGEMQEIMNTVDDKTELMQVYNTLATASAYNYDIDALKLYIGKAKTLTEGNQEYELYTYINEIVLYYIIGDHKNEEKIRGKFSELALQGENYFALKQCENIMADIQRIYRQRS